MIYLDIQKDLKNLAKLAPLKDYIYSGNYDILKVKNDYNKSDVYIVEVLEKLLEEKEIRELIVNYDRSDNHILSYKFR